MSFLKACIFFPRKENISFNPFAWGCLILILCVFLLFWRLCLCLCLCRSGCVCSEGEEESGGVFVLGFSSRVCSAPCVHISRHFFSLCLCISLCVCCISVSVSASVCVCVCSLLLPSCFPVFFCMTWSPVIWFFLLVWFQSVVRFRESIRKLEFKISLYRSDS